MLKKLLKHSKVLPKQWQNSGDNMRRKTFKTLTSARKFARSYKNSTITSIIVNTKLIYIVEYEPNSFTKYWFKHNWSTVLVMFLDLIIISSMIGGVICWLMQ